MERRLHWTARVARNILSLTFSSMVIASAFGQSAGDTKISLSFTSQPLERVMHQLSTETGIYFVYSSNKINVKETVSINVRDKPLADVLVTLGNQLNIVFRIEGRHVTIKGDEHSQNLNAIAVSAPAKNKVMASASPTPTPVLLTTSSAFYYPPATPLTTNLSTNQQDISKEIARLQPYFNSTFLKQVPVSYVRRINTRNNNRSLFFSAGAALNDFSSGIELQAGIRQAYVVFAPGWLRNGDFHGAYGVGSSFNLTHNFSFNPVYLFGTMNGTNRYVQVSDYAGPKAIFVQHRARHHQIKMMLQYAVTPNLVVKLGPTLNQSSTRYKIDEIPITGVTNRYQYDPYNTFHKTSYGPGYGGDSKGSVVYHDYCTHDFWIGWEASISFRLNFLPRKIVASPH